MATYESMSEPCPEQMWRQQKHSFGDVEVFERIAALYDCSKVAILTAEELHTNVAHVTAVKPKWVTCIM